MSDAASLENPIDPADAELAALAKSLANDPKTRRQFLSLVKAKNPDQPIPELDLERQVAAMAAPHLKDIADLKARYEQEAQERGVLAKRQALKAKGFTDEDVTAIEKLMIEKQIGSHDTAADFYRMNSQASVPTPSTFTQVTMPVAGKDVKAAGGIRKWSLNEAHAAVADLKSGRVKLAS